MKLYTKISSIFLSLGLLSTLYAHNHTKDDVKIKTIHVTDNIYMLQGKGGNIGINVGKDGVFMIDDQFAPLSTKIKDAIKKLSKKPIKFMINTHWHYDHTGGNENFAKDNVIIVSHDNVRKRMSKEGFIKAFGAEIPASPTLALPIVTFNDTISFHLNEEEIEVKHLSNAHTGGDSIIYFKTSNVIHTGDIYFNGFYPFIDESSKGDIDGVIKSASYILSIANDKTKIIPGHGKLSNKKELKNYRDTLVIIKDRIQKLIKEGKTLKEVIDSKPIANIEKEWGDGFLSTEKFLTTIYDIIKNK